MSSRSRPKGSQYERELAREFHGKRTPLSGSAGGNDLTFENDSIWAGWGIEAKRRKALPVSIMSWIAQAEYAIPIGSQKKPAVVMRQDHGRSIFACYTEDLIPWASSLAELGNASKAKSMIRQLRRDLDALEGAIR